MEESSSTYCHRNRILLYKDFTTDEPCEEFFDDDGVLLYRFYPDGYPYMDAFVSKTRISDRGSAVRAIKRVSFIVSYINPDIDSEVLITYLDLLCQERFDSDGWLIDRNMIRGIVESNQVLRDYRDVSMRRGKYKFRKGLSISERNKIIATHRYAGRQVLNTTLIQDAIETIKQSNSVFITSKTIAEVIGGEMSQASVKKYMGLFSEDICMYNEQVFGTRSFIKYVKFENINKIVDTIKELVSIRERLTRRNVSKHSGLHLNTVQNLWMEEAIQGTLNKLNHLITA